MKERIQYDDDGLLDEIFTAGGCHLERINRTDWFLTCICADGSEFCVVFSGNVVHTEERAAPSKDGT